MAPEKEDNKRLSQEADVYSFSVLVLETLIGKVPVQYPQPSPVTTSSRTPLLLQRPLPPLRPPLAAAAAADPAPAPRV